MLALFRLQPLRNVGRRPCDAHAGQGAEPAATAHRHRHPHSDAHPGADGDVHGPAVAHPDSHTVAVT